MNASLKSLTCGAAALFAAALCLQAQSADQRQSQRSASPQSTTPPSLQGQQAQPGQQATPDQRNDQWRSGQQQTPGQQSQPGQRDFEPRSSSPTDLNRSRTQSDARSSQQTGAQSQYQTQHQTTVTAETDTQVTTVVQQIDAQGPVVVERVSTQFADVACTPDNARMIFESLRSGDEITLNMEGKTATFRPTGRLGYGEAYIAMALAAEALRGAGVSGCATPEQWRAVLLGGQLSGGTSSTTTVSTTHFPGILTLKSQGQGWGQVAQTTNVQLGQVVNRASTSLNINSNSQGNSWQQRQNQSDPQKRQYQSDQDYQKDQKQQKEQNQYQQDSRSKQPRTSGQEPYRSPDQDKSRYQTTPRNDRDTDSSSQRRSQGER